jgi:lipoprotein-releasing system permease protein
VVIHEKRRDFAVLITMGMTPKTLRGAVAMIGLLVASAGVVTGTVVASVACPVLDGYRIVRLPGGSLLLSYVPFRLLPGHLLWTGILQIAVAFFAGWWAAGDLARLRPAEVLRDE